MIRRPPRSTRTDTLFPYTTLFRTMASPISRYRSIGCERRHLSPNGETMTIRSLTPALSVSPQIDPADVVALAASGFRSIVCNRPDGEEAGQPTAAAIAAAAEIGRAHV